MLSFFALSFHSPFLSLSSVIKSCFNTNTNMINYHPQQPCSIHPNWCRPPSFIEDTAEEPAKSSSSTWPRAMALSSPINRTLFKNNSLNWYLTRSHHHHAHHLSTNPSQIEWKKVCVFLKSQMFRCSILTSNVYIVFVHHTSILSLNKGYLATLNKVCYTPCWFCLFVYMLNVYVFYVV